MSVDLFNRKQSGVSVSWSFSFQYPIQIEDNSEREFRHQLAKRIGVTLRYRKTARKNFHLSTFLLKTYYC